MELENVTVETANKRKKNTFSTKMDIKQTKKAATEDRTGLHKQDSWSFGANKVQVWTMHMTS